MRERKLRKIKKFDPVFVIIAILLLLHGITLILPFFWMLLTSFKDVLEMSDSFLGLPMKFHFSYYGMPSSITEFLENTKDFWINYTNSLKYLPVEIIKNGKKDSVGIPGLLGNSFLLATVRSFFGLLPTVLASYAVAKYDFKLRKTIFNINIFVMTIPIVGSLATTLRVYDQLHIYNNFWAYMILPHHPFGFNFLLLYGAFKAIPNSYSEAVMIDGGGHFTIFFKIILPTILPTLTALYILAFIGNWNDYNSALLYVRNSPTLAYGLYEFEYGTEANKMQLPEILAGFTICSIPSVVLYCAFQPLIGKSLAMGGLKE